MPSIDLSYDWLIVKCYDDKVGYSQDYRQQQTVNGITYFDCSSILWYSLLYGDFDVVSANGSSYPFTTQTMGVVLEKLGFTRYNANEVGWQKGDIVWRNGHCEMVYIPNRTMGAHTDSYELERQVSINTYESDKNDYTYIYRYNGVIDTIEPILSKRKRKMKIWLLPTRKQ